MFTETVDAEGHLIDSGDLQNILTTIVEHDASYEILTFEIGRTNADASRLSLRLGSGTREGLDNLLASLSACFFANSASFLVCIVTFVSMRRSEFEPKPEPKETKGHVRAGHFPVDGLGARLEHFLGEGAGGLADRLLRLGQADVHESLSGWP